MGSNKTEIEHLRVQYKELEEQKLQLISYYRQLQEDLDTKLEEYENEMDKIKEQIELLEDKQLSIEFGAEKNAEEQNTAKKS